MSSSIIFFILYRGVKRGHLYNHIPLAADALVHIDVGKARLRGPFRCSSVLCRLRSCHQMRTMLFQIQLRLRHPQRRRLRHHRSARRIGHENLSAPPGRRRQPKRPSQEGPSHRTPPGGAPRTPSTPPPGALVRELRERREYEMCGSRWKKHRGLQAVAFGEDRPRGINDQRQPILLATFFPRIHRVGGR